MYFARRVGGGADGFIRRRRNNNIPGNVSEIRDGLASDEKIYGSTVLVGYSGKRPSANAARG